MNMKNKKGFLLGEETLKVVIAVICIAFLVYLLVAIYFSLTGEQKLKEAESTINNLVAPEIGRVNSEGEPNLQGILLPNPAEWFIFSYIGEEPKPNSCIEQNCLCICERVALDFFNWQIKKCDDKGVCINVDNLAKFEMIKIEKAGVQISIEKINEQIQIGKK